MIKYIIQMVYGSTTRIGSYVKLLPLKHQHWTAVIYWCR